MIKRTLSRYRNPLAQLSSQSGYSLMQILVATSITGILTVAAVSVTKNILQVKLLNNSRISLTEIRERIRERLEDDSAWIYTLEDVQNKTSPSFECMDFLTVGVDCTDRTGPLLIKDESDRIFYDPAFGAGAASNGFDLNGANCNGYDSVNGNMQCPFRADIHWRTYCASGVNPCLTPTREVSVAFSAKFGDASPELANIQVSKYDFVILR